MSRFTSAPLFLSALLFVAANPAVPAQPKKVVNSAADLPRFRYPLNQPASQFLTADDATFNAFLRKVEGDVNSVLADYTITDKSTLREMLGTRLNGQMLSGDMTGAQATAKQIRDLEVKPAAKLTTGLMTFAIVQAYQDAGAATGPAYEEAFQKRFAQEIDPLPWTTVGDTLKEMRTGVELRSINLLAGNARENLDPAVAKNGGLDLPEAETEIAMRVTEKFYLPLNKRVLAVLSPYIAAHEVAKPDIWAARDVTLTSGDNLTPVRIAIFDSGVDTSLYPGLLYVDPHPGAHSPNGLAFDMQGNLYDGNLQPLTAEQKDEYPNVLTVIQGLDDLRNGIDSPAAADARKTLSAMPSGKVASFLKQLDFLSQYLHGTHVAGIAVRGNPAARLVVAQFYDSLADIPFAPSMAWAEKFKADFLQVGNYFHEHNIRVVNMSWTDDIAEFEEWLTKTSPEQDPAKRKEFASRIYRVWSDAISAAIQAAPNTLWVCAAGNSDSNAGFTGDVPASLQLPNLITVGAVDQAGDETSFTSYGKTVFLYADGYEVPSYVPGGKQLKLSGTSMASPNVANLAAKLIALDPKLTPEQTIALMKQSASASKDGRVHLIDPKAAVALLHQQYASK
jgi:subtilisin family serine protease